MDFERDYSHEHLYEAANLLREVLAHMGYSHLDVNLEIIDDNAIFNVVGQNAAELLTDNRGHINTEISNALGWILRRARFAIASAYNFFVDVDGYRLQRLNDLADMASELHEKACAGLQIDIFGMDPVDRRAVHNALSSYDDITTQSEGNAIFRRLQIRPNFQNDLPVMAIDDDYLNR